MIANIVGIDRFYKGKMTLGYKYRITIGKSTVESLRFYTTKHKASSAAERFMAKIEKTI